MPYTSPTILGPTILSPTILGTAIVGPAEDACQSGIAVRKPAFYLGLEACAHSILERTDTKCPMRKGSRAPRPRAEGRIIKPLLLWTKSFMEGPRRGHQEGPNSMFRKISVALAWLAGSAIAASTT